jgi:hypothetical protein
MALLENRTGASVNPGHRQNNGQIVVFVAERASHVRRLVVHQFGQAVMAKVLNEILLLLPSRTRHGNRARSRELDQAERMREWILNLTRAPVTTAQRDVDQLSEEKPRLGTGA